MMQFILLLMMLVFVHASNEVPLKDNMLFGFEKCKTLGVDLEKGQLAETTTSSFDLHCKKSQTDPLEFSCEYFETASNKKPPQDVLRGGSHLGRAELVSKSGTKIKFLIGKGFASYESGSEKKVCAGIFIFEQDALKQKSSSPKSGL